MSERGRKYEYTAPKDKLNYGFLIFRQIERILESLDNEVYVLNIRNLEIILRPYIDEDYLKEKDALLQSYYKYGERKYDEMGSLRYELSEVNYLEYYQNLFLKLIELCDSAGIIREMIRVGIET